MKFEDEDSNFVLVLIATESATGFYLADNTGYMTEICGLKLNKLKSLRASIDLEIERLTPNPNGVSSDHA